MSTPNSEQVGITKVVMVEQALLKLKNERRRSIPPIVEVTRPKRPLMLNQSRPDFVVVIEGGCELKLQVRSIACGEYRKSRLMEQIGHITPTIFIKDDDSFEDILHSVAKYIRLLWNTIRRKVNWKTHLRRIRGMQKVSCIQKFDSLSSYS